MSVVDACSWLDTLRAASRPKFFAPALGDTERLVVPTIGLLEVFKRVAQQRNVGWALQAIALMRAPVSHGR